MCVLVDMGADSGPVVAEASHRHNTSTQVQDIFRQKEQAQQLGYRRMKQMFRQRWQSMDLQSRQPTHGLRKLSERMMGSRRISEEVGSTASGWYMATQSASAQHAAGLRSWWPSRQLAQSLGWEGLALCSGQPPGPMSACMMLQLISNAACLSNNGMPCTQLAINWLLH